MCRVSNWNVTCGVLRTPLANGPELGGVETFGGAVMTCSNRQIGPMLHAPAAKNWHGTLEGARSGGFPTWGNGHFSPSLQKPRVKNLQGPNGLVGRGEVGELPIPKLTVGDFVGVRGARGAVGDAAACESRHVSPYRHVPCA